MINYQLLIDEEVITTATFKNRQEAESHFKEWLGLDSESNYRIRELKKKACAVCGETGGGFGTFVRDADLKVFYVCDNCIKDSESHNINDFNTYLDAEYTTIVIDAKKRKRLIKDYLKAKNNMVSKTKI